MLTYYLLFILCPTPYKENNFVNFNFHNIAKLFSAFCLVKTSNRPWDVYKYAKIKSKTWYIAVGLGLVKQTVQ
jgi:hypothetical protein